MTLESTPTNSMNRAIMNKTIRKTFIQKLIRGVIDYQESERRRITTSTTRDERGLAKKTITILGRRKRYGYKTIGTALQTPNTSRTNAAILKIIEDLRQSRTRALRKNIQRVDPILYGIRKTPFIFHNVIILHSLTRHSWKAARPIQKQYCVLLELHITQGQLESPEKQTQLS